MEVLSQSQIDDLLNSLTSGEVDLAAVSEDTSAKKVKDYDFRTPKRFTKENIKVLSSVYENFARQLSSYFTSLLRLYVNAELVNIEEQRYSEFSNALPDAVMMGIGEMRFTGSTDDNNTVMMDISKSTSFAVVERLMGGSGDGFNNITRDFTEIEISLLETVFKGIFPRMVDAWSNYFELDTLFRRIETNSRLTQGIAPDETVVIVVLDLSIKDMQGTISVCIPAVCLEDVMKRVDSQYIRNLRRINSAGDKERREVVMRYLRDSELELRSVIGSTEVSLGDIIYLNVGDILQLNKPVSSLVELNVGESCWFRGTMGVHRNKKALLIQEVL